VNRFITTPEHQGSIGGEIVSPASAAASPSRSLSMKFRPRHVRRRRMTQTAQPDCQWMQQMARNVTMVDVGFLNGCRYLLHDRDATFCAEFDRGFKAVGIEALKLPPRSPNLNAHLERRNRSIKEECLSKLILFGETSLRHVLKEYAAHFHRERNHQGRGNMILLPNPEDRIGAVNGA